MCADSIISLSINFIRGAVQLIFTSHVVLLCSTSTTIIVKDIHMVTQIYNANCKSAKILVAEILKNGFKSHI